MPVKLVRVRRNRIADLLGRQRHDELATGINGNLGGGGGIVVAIGAVAHLVRADSTTRNLSHAIGHALILARSLGSPLHLRVDARDLTVGLAAHSLGRGLDFRRTLGRLLDGELARQAFGGKLVVTRVVARQFGNSRRVGAGFDLGAVDVRGDIVTFDDIVEFRLGAVLLAVVGELSSGVPRYGELALVDRKGAILERNLVVGVGALRLRQVQSIAAVAHTVVIIALNLNTLKALALNELARSHVIRKLGIVLTIGLGGVLRRDRYRTRFDLKRHLAVDRRAVDRDAIVDRHTAGILDAGRNARPAAVSSLIFNDGTFGQRRGVDRVVLAVIFARVALDAQGRNLYRARLMAAHGALPVLGAGLGNRRLLVDRPFVLMFGVHLNCDGLFIAGSVRSHDYMLSTGITFSGLNRVLSVLASRELLAVIGNRHRLVAVIEHVKRNALAVGIAFEEVINGGGVSVHIGIGLFIPFAAANPADLLTNAIGFGRGGRNDLVFPPAGLALQLLLLAVLADLNVATFAIRLPSSIVGNSMRALLDLDLGIGRRIVVVILGIADVVRSRLRKTGQLIVRRYLLVLLAKLVAVFHFLGHARDGTVFTIARGPIIAHKVSRRFLVCLGNLHGRLARNGQVVGSRHTVTGRVLGRIAIGRLFRRPIAALFAVLDLHIRRLGVILNVDRNAVFFAVIGAIEAGDLKVKTCNVNDLPFERQNTCGAAIGREVALTDDNALVLPRLGLLQSGFTSSAELVILALNEIDPLAGTVLELCTFNDRLMFLAVIGILARALAAVFKGERLTRGSLKARNDIVVAGVRRGALELVAVFICLGVRLGLALIPREFIAGRHAHLLQIPRAVLVQSDLDRAAVIDKRSALRARCLGHGELVRGRQVLFGLAVLVLAIFALAVAERAHARRLNAHAVSFNLPLVLVDGLAEGEIAVEVHDLVLVGVVVVLGRAVWHNAFDLVGFAGAKGTRLYAITVRSLLNRDPNIVSKASAYGEVRRDIQRRDVGIDTLFLRDIQALGGSRSFISFSVLVAIISIVGVAVLPVARDFRRSIEGKGPGGVNHARIAARAIARNFATVYVAASASCNIKGINRQSIVSGARTRAVEVAHRAAVEVDRSVGDAHHAGDSISIKNRGVSKITRRFDRLIAIVRLPDAQVLPIAATEAAIVERRCQLCDSASVFGHLEAAVAINGNSAIKVSGRIVELAVGKSRREGIDVATSRIPALTEKMCRDGILLSVARHCARPTNMALDLQLFELGGQLALGASQRNRRHLLVEPTAVREEKVLRTIAEL